MTEISNQLKENSIVGYIENAVPIEVIAKATKRSTNEVEDDLRQLGLYIGEDWRGQPAVSEVDAHGLVSGQVRRTQADEAEWAAHLAECEQWTSRRDELVRSAQRGAELAEQRAGRGGGDAASAGVEAGRSAGADYEAANPPPLWRGEECGNARRLFTAEKRGLLGRALDVLAGSPR